MRRASKIDTVAPDLVQLIKASGAEWEPWPGGPIDGLVLMRDRVLIVDFKSKHGTLTEKQRKLVASGWPIVFCRTDADVREMLASVR